jgi:phosphate transport system substrate-binding protein
MKVQTDSTDRSAQASAPRKAHSCHPGEQSSVEPSARNTRNLAQCLVPQPVGGFLQCTGRMNLALVVMTRGLRMVTSVEAMAGGRLIESSAATVPRITPARAISWLAGLLAILVLGTAATATAELSYVGSSALGDYIIPVAAEVFTKKTGVKLRSIDTQGSGKGLELVVRGAAPLAGVSRALTFVEKQQRIYYQTIGYDAVGVYVHDSNPVISLSKAALKGIYTGRIRSWNEVGGKHEPVVVITQIWGAQRGQMLEFRDKVMDGAAYREDRSEMDRGTEQVSALAAEPRGITAVSFAVAPPGLRVVAIEGFTPDAVSVRSGAYLLSRPLLLVTPARPDPDVRRFVEFMLSPEGQAIVARKFLPVR